jgi:hypothetical protein
VATIASLLVTGCGEQPAQVAASPRPVVPTSASSTTGTPATTTSTPTSVASVTAQLPRGGRRLFPDYRVVAYYGAAQTPALGVLGHTSPDEAAKRLKQRAKAYERRGRPVMPAFELIVTIANAHPGPSGMYRTRTPHDVIRRYLAAARRHKALLLLDVQPGRADFFTEVRYYEPLLREPDVGLALDPEWSMGPTGVPGRRIGSTNAATINRVSAWLDGIVQRHRLPQKLFVVHQFTYSMVRDKQRVVPRKGLATTFHIDGFGGQSIKKRKYDQLKSTRRWHNGFKLFLKADTRMMAPHQVMAMRPQPDLVTYQ